MGRKYRIVVNGKTYDVDVEEVRCKEGDSVNTGDVLLAASELLGRVIVDTCETPVSAIQMAEVMESHIKRTLQAGYTARGYSMGPMEL